MNQHFIKAVCIGLALVLLPHWLHAAASPPNIIYILADDLGYGDVSCYNKESKIQTPHIDRLAASGARFTDAHTPTAVCTPTRYAILTGRYPWRTRLAKGVLLDYEASLIAEGRLTVPQLMRQAGYSTHCIGKWHLGFDWDLGTHPRHWFEPKKEDSLTVTEAHLNAWKDVFSKPVTGGPIHRGFDTYFGVDVPNISPYAYFRGDRLTAMPTEMKGHTDLTDIGRITTTGTAGPIVAGWKFDQIMPDLVKEAKQLIEERAKAKQPFFLYFSLTAPHFPVYPSAAFRGKSGLGDLGDFILETDAALGEVMNVLEQTGLRENTLVFFTSDNGPAKNSRTPLNEAGHKGAGPLRGKKQSVYEGGHRVPFIASWPAVTTAGTTITEPICHTNLLATCADYLSVPLPDSAGEDSTSILYLLRNISGKKPRHSFIIHDSGSGVFAVREKDMKLILCPKGGVELYNLATDLAEQHNVAEQHPQLVRHMTNRLQLSIAHGRSTNGKLQSNDRVVRMRTPTVPLLE